MAKAGQGHDSQTADLYQHDNDEQPSDVNVEETSTETNPVTQMAIVAVNRASIKEMP